MNARLKHLYGLDAIKIEKSGVGAGSDTYFVSCTDGKYVVKYPASSEINHPEAEPVLCGFFGGGDLNGIKLLFPEITARIIFAVIGIVHGIIIGKHLLPEYKKAFQQGE